MYRGFAWQVLQTIVPKRDAEERELSEGAREKEGVERMRKRKDRAVTKGGYEGMGY